MTAPASGSRLFSVYVAVSLVPVLALGIVATATIRNDTRDRAITDALNRAQTIAQTGIEPVLDGHDLSSGVTSVERLRLVHTASSLQGPTSVLRLRVRAPAGTIVFDVAHPKAAPVPDRDDEVIAAAHGHPVRTVTTLNADAVDGSVKGGTRAVETYVALTNGHGRTIGVLETYLPYAPFEAAAVHSSQRLSWVLFVGLLALWVLLAVISWSVTRRLRRSATDNEWLARHDTLTGLANRLAFAEAVAAATGFGPSRAAANRAVVAVVDLDRFREDNDALGQANGDRFLQGVAGWLRARLTDEALLARLGGDQFGVLITGEESSAGELGRALTAEPVNVTVDGLEISVEVQVGTADSITITDPAPGALLRAAELALHAGKEAGVPVQPYHRHLDRFDPTRLTLAGELRHALQAGQLVLWYQPKVDLRTGGVIGVEALVRWNHPDRGLIPPSEFLPVAESTSLIEPLTAWVIDEAARQVALWQASGLVVTVAVNVSARNLRDPSLIDIVRTSLERHALSPAALEIELTETAAVQDPVSAALRLDELARLGVRTSLDDFGQGATSLASLAGLPLAELKIDRAFVTALEVSSASAAIVGSVIDLGHALGLRVIAEGVERQSAADRLRDLGCDAAQGYLFAPPLRASEAVSWLAARRLASL